MLYPRVAPGADGDVRLGRRHGQGDRQAHDVDARPRRRTPTAPSYALVAGLPEHKIRVISPDIGGGFGNKVGIYPGYVLRDRRLDRHRQAGEVDGGPLREPDVDGVRPRLPHARRDRRDAATARSSACASTCSPTTARSTAPPSRPSTRPASSTSSPAPTTTPAAHCKVTRRVHEQGARRRRLRLLVPHHRGGVPRRADGRLPRRRAAAWIRPSCG